MKPGEISARKKAENKIISIEEIEKGMPKFSGKPRLGISATSRLYATQDPDPHPDLPKNIGYLARKHTYASMRKKLIHEPKQKVNIDEHAEKFGRDAHPQMFITNARPASQGDAARVVTTRSLEGSTSETSRD